MNNLIIGTAGHIDHGKTELIKALTWVDTDRLKDEKARGISIDLGFASISIEGEETVLGIVDVPGHEAFIRNMLAGVTGVDLVLFVIAADEGIMPQTREHLDILRFLDVRRGVLVITKADLVDKEWLELVIDEAEELMTGSFLEDAPVVVTSTKSGSGLDELRDKLLEVAREIESRPADDIFRLPIDRVFTIKGMGTVVTGTIWSGSVEMDQLLTVFPAGKTARVKGIQVHSVNRDCASAGTRVALGLSGLSRWEIERGSTALRLDEWRPSMMIDVFLNYLPQGTRPLKNRTRVRMHLATQEVMARVVLLEGRELTGGESAYVQIRLEGPAIARKGDRFVIRSYSPLMTIGGGTVLVPCASKRTRISATDREHLDILHSDRPTEVITSLIRNRGDKGYNAGLLPVDVGIGPDAAKAALTRMCSEGEVVELKGELFHSSSVDSLKERVLETLAVYHRENPLQQGLKREELKHRIKRVFSDNLLDGVLNLLTREGEIEVRGGEVKLASHEIVFDKGLDKMANNIISHLAANQLAPPDLNGLSEELNVDRKKVVQVLAALQKTGRVAKVDENIWLVSTGAELARKKVEEFLAGKGKATASELRAMLGVSRKYAIPILEYLDRIGVTYRRGDHRYLK